MVAPRPEGFILTDNACGGVVKAFTYAAGGQQIIILCSNSDKGALISSFTSLDQWRTGGNLKLEALVQEKGLDFLGVYLSTTILHELIHATSFAEQLKFLQLAQCKSSPPTSHINIIFYSNNFSKFQQSFQIKLTINPSAKCNPPEIYMLVEHTANKQ